MAGRSIAPAGLVVPNPARAVSEIASRFRNVLIALAALMGILVLAANTGGRSSGTAVPAPGAAQQAASDTDDAADSGAAAQRR